MQQEEGGREERCCFIQGDGGNAVSPGGGEVLPSMEQGKT
jgi:hypothetical protein